VEKLPSDCVSEMTRTTTGGVVGALVVGGTVVGATWVVGRTGWLDVCGCTKSKGHIANETLNYYASVTLDTNCA